MHVVLSQVIQYGSISRITYEPESSMVFVQLIPRKIKHIRVKLNQVLRDWSMETPSVLALNSLPEISATVGRKSQNAET